MSATLKSRIDKLLRRRRSISVASVCVLPQYPGLQRDIGRYAREILGVSPTPDQDALFEKLVASRKLLVRSGHNVGKSFAASIVVNWFFDTHYPAVALTTAPTERQVRDILWKEVRLLRSRANVGEGVFPGPKICRIETGPDHFAQGFTARDGTKFQGHHSPNILIVFDEAEGVEPVFWQAAKTMLGGNCYFLAIYNPTQSGGPTVEAEESGEYETHQISALDHPNIAAHFAGLPAPYPSAIGYSQLRDMIKSWADAIPAGDATANDFEFDGQWWRPSAVCEARVLGRRPTQAVDGVWSSSLVESCFRGSPVPDSWPVQIGCDVARFGDDATCIAVRRGLALVHVEYHYGWSTKQTAMRLKQLCDELGKPHSPSPTQIPCLIDETGVGGGVIDQHDGYNFVGVNAQATPYSTDYANARAELWFNPAILAKEGGIDFGHLPQAHRQRLKKELTSPLYWLNAKGKIVVEEKSAVKKRLKTSPDLADAVNLAYYPTPEA